MAKHTAPIEWSDLLRRAVEEPGVISKAYSTFHRFSIRNQLLAWAQIEDRGLPLGPIASYKKWRGLGRQVKRGQKAILLCMPITVKAKEKDPETGETVEYPRRVFVFKPHWFTLAQTDGDDVAEEAFTADWDRSLAMAELNITEIPFDHVDGNCQGFARGQSIAINPIALHPEKTTFHELAHVVLGHTEGGKTSAHGEDMPRSLKEAEAESVCLILLESLGLSGGEFCRGYIQNWLAGAEIPSKSAQRIFTAADKILKSGLPVTVDQREAA